jgi:hypothetical protein
LRCHDHLLSRIGSVLLRRRCQGKLYAEAPRVPHAQSVGKSRRAAAPVI